MTPLDECVATFRRWLHLPDVGALLVTLATVVANETPGGDPVWLLIVGPPGGGKSETLIPLFGRTDIHPTATLTVPALLSGTPKKEREGAAKGGLLRSIGEFGIIVMKDFTSVISMHRDARAEVLAALREIYDGSWTRHVGTGGGLTLHWEGKVGLIAGCTPTIDSAHAVMGSMGERFVFYRLPPIDGEAQVAKALEHIGDVDTMRTELTEAVGKVLAQANTDRPARLDADDGARINRLANLAARCRSAVERDGYSREIELIPEPEAPARISQVLVLLHHGLAAIGAGPDQIWPVLTKVALDSMPSIRRTVLEAVAATTGPGGPTTSQVADTAGYPNKTTFRALEDLAVHGVLHRTRGGSREPDTWTLTAWTLARWPETSGALSPAQIEEKTFRASEPTEAVA